ncbi:hypothetical protein J8TS2_33960 [Lederbergia ruris]|uniref:Uncharacterized protein n=2 Tax=Lederbergia TaxID=2804231 RepID=A0A178A044_9BACI|nr:hypothetical protein [Lederbergia galactosidilytica]KRG13137.1 hypothetical protein ACA30_16150 [Virgibacillus soli]OAK73514.1 hypothetical protein ABB05_06695 [Lederbergia galactosidilytica]GIN59077.1 hypothetical protein J8TS2_33960 [Lederbergia ruris]
MILLLVIMYAISLLLIMLGSIWCMNVFAKKYIGEKHLVLEEVTNGEVPEKWSRQYQMKIKNLEAKGNTKKASRIEKTAQKSYSKKLQRLVRYIQKTNLVESEETRSILLSDLEKTRRQWRNQLPNEE